MQAAVFDFPPDDTTQEHIIVAGEKAEVCLYSGESVGLDAL